MRDFHAPGRSAALATRGMAATSMPVATLAAIDILKRGGNALDAAIAASAVLAVVEPQSTGIGGDCFCLYAPAGTGEPVTINGSGRAPAAASMDALRARGVSELHPESAHVVTIPGAVSAWEKLHRAHGRAAWDSLFAEAIRLAAEGHPVHARVARDWSDAAPRLARNAASARHFLPGGAAPHEGDLFVQPALAATLRAIAKDGARALYTGAVAEDLLATLREAGGLHAEADFAAGLDGAEFVTPITRPWRGLDIFECPPNGSGVIALMLLGLLEGFDTPPGGPLSVARIHRHVEAARLAYRDRDAFIADPAQAEVPLARLLSDAYLRTAARHIRDDRAMAELPALADWLPVHADTVCLCVVDRDGNACSFINSLFESFGAGILAERSGVMLHNRGYGFRFEEGHPNAIAPGKRPMHTIIPGMVMEGGRAVMPFGVMGGHYQPMGQSWLLASHFEHGLDPQAAVDLPRMLPRLGVLQVERGIPAGTLAALARLGHAVQVVDKPHGGAQAIRIDHGRGVLIGASDPRKDGCAAGF
jgi:gamma-glutamyltranspeptidase/glutathione hydrolase